MLGKPVAGFLPEPRNQGDDLLPELRKPGTDLLQDRGNPADKFLPEFYNPFSPIRWLRSSAIHHRQLVRNYRAIPQRRHLH